MKKVFFFDIDGTLLPAGNNKQVHAKTVEALQELEKAGHDVILTTGRAESMIQDQIKALGASNHITMNGAQVVIDNEVKHAERMTQETIEQLKAVADENKLMLGCLTREDYYLIEKKFDEALAYSILSAVSLPMPDIKADIPQEDVISQLWFLGSQENLDFSRPIIPGHQILKWHSQACDVVIEGVSKASGIKKYIELLYPDTEIKSFAFGDGYNDVEMFKFVDTGIAMDNAVSPLKEVADAITDSCEDLGVYHYLLKNGHLD